MHTVGLLAPTGSLGRLLIPHLVQAHREGKIKLILFPRPTSDLSKLGIPHDAGMEIRPVDLEGSGNEELLDKAMTGLDLVISTIGLEGISSQLPVIRSLSRVSPEAVFIPAQYGPQWTDIPGDKALKARMDPVTDLGKELGVACTVVSTGLFADLFFQYKILGFDIDKNQLVLSPEMMSRGIPITSHQYLVSALTNLALCPPHDLKGRRFVVVEHSPTGQQLLDLLSTIHGNPPSVLPYKPSEEEEDFPRQLRHYWSTGGWVEGETVEVAEGKRELIPLARSFMQQ